jgi:hypothetical protein
MRNGEAVVVDVEIDEAAVARYLADRIVRRHGSTSATGLEGAVRAKRVAK